MEPTNPAPSRGVPHSKVMDDQKEDKVAGKLRLADATQVQLNHSHAASKQPQKLRLSNGVAYSSEEHTDDRNRAKDGND